MRTKALTASEATARLIELGFSKDNFSMNFIEDNAFTLPYGPTSFRYENPTHNEFNPAFVVWEFVGVRYCIAIKEDSKGNSNIYLERWDGEFGKTIATYNKMTAAEKKAFMEMLENATRYESHAPKKFWDGWKDASFKDEKGIFHSAWYDDKGNYHTR